VYTTEILCDSFQMLGGKSEQPQQAVPAPVPAQDLPEGDLPF